MKSIKTKAIGLIVLACIAVLPVAVMAQGDGPVDPEETPIDGGLTLLIAAGAAYGVKKYRDARQKNEEEAK